MIMQSAGPVHCFGRDIFNFTAIKNLELLVKAKVLAKIPSDCFHMLGEHQFVSTFEL